MFLFDFLTFSDLASFVSVLCSLVSALISSLNPGLCGVAQTTAKIFLIQDYDIV